MTEAQADKWFRGWMDAVHNSGDGFTAAAPCGRNKLYRAVRHGTVRIEWRSRDFVALVKAMIACGELGG